MGSGTTAEGARESVRHLVADALSALSASDRRRYRLAVFAQVLLSLLDLIGVLLLGVVGFLLASGSSSTLPGGLSGTLAQIGLSGESAALVLAAIAAALLLLKSVLALTIQRRITLFLGIRSATVGNELATRFLNQSMLRVQSVPSQKVTYALMEGVTGLIVSVLGSYLIIVSEIALMVVLTTGLLIVDPLTALVTVTYFGLVGFGLSRWLRSKARRAGRLNTETAVLARTTAHNALDTYAETTVMNRRDHFVAQFREARLGYASSRAEVLVVGLAPRYGMEAALVVGAGITTATLLLTGDRVAAIAGLTLFLAAAMRLIPALLRLNAAYITLHNQSAAARAAHELAESIDVTGDRSARDIDVDFDEHQHPQDFPQVRSGARVTVDDVSVEYPGSHHMALHAVSLTVEPGCSLALAGPTGSGKSTLLMTILGLLQPMSGKVRIDGEHPLTLTRSNSGAIGYVPQAVALIDASIRENVALALPETAVNDDQVWSALRKANLEEFVAALPFGLDTTIGERGVRLSGGQRQRIGLARALYMTPRLLVLDEATSALDAETENVIADTIASLEGRVTRITVAHRLATVRQADAVAYIENGRLVSLGSFEEVRRAVPGFERQAQLLGL